MRPSTAVDAARDILMTSRRLEAPRLDRIAKAMRPPQRSDDVGRTIPADAPEVMRELVHTARTNFLPLVVDTFSQVMKVDGIYSSGAKDRASMWRYWQRNRMDARQTGIHRAALTYGTSYLKVLPGEAAGDPVMQGVSPRRLTAMYQDPADDEWPMQALEITSDGSMVKLYDETSVYYIGNETKSLFIENGEVSIRPSDLTFIEERKHGFEADGKPTCPIVRYRDRMLLAGEEQCGIIEPLLTIQERIDETTFGMLVAQYFAAFKQRYAIGWVPESEQERLAFGASRMLTFDQDPGTLSLGEFSETDLTRYIDSKASAIRDLSAIGQVPAQNLGVDGVSNISAETLAALEAGKDRKADEITTSLGESHEQALRACAFYAGDTEAAQDFSSEVRWKDATARSFAQTVDGLGKLAQMLQVPVELLWEQIPGWTQQTVERARSIAGDFPADPVLEQVSRTLQQVGQPIPGGTSAGPTSSGS